MDRIIRVEVIVPNQHSEIKEKDLLSQVLTNHNYRIKSLIGRLTVFGEDIMLLINFDHTKNIETYVRFTDFINEVYLIENEELQKIDLPEIKKRRKSFKVTIPGIVLTTDGIDELIQDYRGSEEQKPKDNLVYPVLRP